MCRHSIKHSSTLGLYIRLWVCLVFGSIQTGLLCAPRPLLPLRGMIPQGHGYGVTSMQVGAGPTSTFRAVWGE